MNRNLYEIILEVSSEINLSIVFNKPKDNYNKKQQQLKMDKQNEKIFNNQFITIRWWISG